jgi:hypothetical protein
MPTTRPGFIWSGTEWVAIGQEAVVNPFYYQATAPTGAATGAIWIESDVDVPSIDSSQFLRWRKTMAGGETSLSGNDDSSLPLAYTPGYEQLYINGVLQVRGGDYTATTGTTVTGLTALVANDVVEIFSAVARTVADVYTQTQSDARFVNKNVGGLSLVVPTSVTGGTVSANGAVTIGSAVSSVTVNGAFSAAYDNYKIIISSGGTVGNDYGSLRLGSSTSTYNYAAQTLQYSTAAFGGFGVGTNASEFRYVWSNANSTGYTGNVELQNPFLAQYTRLVSDYASDDYRFFMGGVHKTASSYTSFTLGPNAFTGTLTGGTIRIYGYNNGA